MNFDEVFEDLEAQFESIGNQNAANSHISLIERSNLLEITTIQNARMRVLAPIIGKDFIAAIEEHLPNWIVLPAKSIREINFISLADAAVPKVRNRNSDIVDFISELPRPSDLLICIAGETAKYLFRENNQQFLFVSPSSKKSDSDLSAISIDAIDWLLLVENSGSIQFLGPN